MAVAQSYLTGKQVLQGRDKKYNALLYNKLFKVTHQTPGTDITGATGYVATTPTFMLYNTGTSTNDVILGSIWLSQVGTVAGGFIDIVVMIDSVNRYASGGTAVVPQNSNMGSAVTAGAAFRTTPTASAATATQRVVWATSAPKTLGTTTVIDFQDGIRIGTTGSILIYTFAGTTGPSWAFNLEFTEE